MFRRMTNNSSKIGKTLSISSKNKWLKRITPIKAVHNHTKKQYLT